MNTIKELIDDASKKIGYIEANILMEYVLNEDKIFLNVNFDKVIDTNQLQIFNDLIKKVENGYPLQYITHKQEFMGLEFYVDDNVLIPQPDTEVLVEETISALEKKLENYNVDNNVDNKDCKEIRILDLCTGSGAIVISIANYLVNKYGLETINQIKFVASDISKSALEIAKRNYENIILKNIKIDFIESDMFTNIKGTFDIIVSNPPYIRSKEIEHLNKDVQNEPHLALDGGEDGLKFYKIIREHMNRFLRNQGELLLEIGYDQKEELLNMFDGAKCIKDLGGNDRVIHVKK